MDKLAKISYYFHLNAIKSKQSSVF